MAVSVHNLQKNHKSDIYSRGTTPNTKHGSSVCGENGTYGSKTNEFYGKSCSYGKENAHEQYLNDFSRFCSKYDGRKNFEKGKFDEKLPSKDYSCSGTESSQLYKELFGSNNSPYVQKKTENNTFETPVINTITPETQCFLDLMELTSGNKTAGFSVIRDRFQNQACPSDDKIVAKKNKKPSGENSFSKPKFSTTQTKSKSTKCGLNTSEKNKIKVKSKKPSNNNIPTLSKSKLDDNLASAVTGSDPRLVNRLLKQQPDVNSIISSDVSDKTLLHQAALNGCLLVAKSLIAAGANVEAQTNKGNTPIHFAAREGHDEVVRELISSGANVNALNSYGVNALQFAISHGHVGIINTLLSHNADPDLCDLAGDSPSSIAKELGYNISEIKSLTQEQCESPERVPINVQLILAAEQGCVPKVKSCLKLGANPNIIVPLALHWPAKSTILHRSACTGKDMLLRLLIREGSSVNVSDVVGNTPLHAAAQKGNNIAVKVLLAAGAKLDDKSLRGMTPLHRAASKGRYQTVKLLLDRGASTMQKDEEGRTPADWANKRGFYGLAAMLGFKLCSSSDLIKESKSQTFSNQLSGSNNDSCGK